MLANIATQVMFFTLERCVEESGTPALCKFFTTIPKQALDFPYNSLHRVHLTVVDVIIFYLVFFLTFYDVFPRALLAGLLGVQVAGHGFSSPLPPPFKPLALFFYLFHNNLSSAILS